MFLTKALFNVKTMTRMNVVDNTELGRQVKEAGKRVKIIRIYTKSKHQCGGLGDKVLVTIMGQMKKGIIVGCVAEQKAFVPKFDSNNIVLIDDHNVPLGTRITAPLPNQLRSRGGSTFRLMAIGTKFV